MHVTWRYACIDMCGNIVVRTVDFCLGLLHYLVVLHVNCPIGLWLCWRLPCTLGLALWLVVPSASSRHMNHGILHSRHLYNRNILLANNVAVSVLSILFVLLSLQVPRLGRETLQQQCLLKPSLYKIEASCTKLQACKAVQRWGIGGIFSLSYANWPHNHGLTGKKLLAFGGEDSEGGGTNLWTHSICGPDCTKGMAGDVNGGDNSLCRGGVCAFVGLGLALAVERRARATFKTFTTFWSWPVTAIFRAPPDFSSGLWSLDLVLRPSAILRRTLRFTTFSLKNRLAKTLTVNVRQCMALHTPNPWPTGVLCKVQELCQMRRLRPLKLPFAILLPFFVLESLWIAI